MKHYFACSVCAALLLGLCLAPAAPASAFCVYNDSDMRLTVQQVTGCLQFECFQKAIKPGEKACCNWKNKGCNNQGQRDSELKFNVLFLETLYCQEVKVKAGGWLVIKGADKKITCTAHYE